MTLTELCAAVGEIVNRPDLEGTVIKSHVKAATYQAHGLEDWWRDRVDTQLTFSTSNYYQTIDHTVLDRFRKWDYMRIWDPNGYDPLTGAATGSAGKFFEIYKDASSLFDAYGNTKPYTCRAVGGVSQLRSVTMFSQILAGWYQNPIVTPDGSYSSWIADTNPYAIIYRAVSLMFAGNNQQDQSRKWEKMELEMRQQLIMNNLDSRGG